MLTRLVIVFGILAVVVSFAGSVPAPGSTYKITFSQPSVVKGMEFKPGEYQVVLGTDKVTIRAGKVSQDFPAKIETGAEKFPVTTIRFNSENGKQSVMEIRLGGTTTKLVFN